MMTQSYTLTNDYITIEVNSFGAEMTKLIKNDTKHNYLWNGDSKYWGRISPVLFPIVGKLKNNEYTWKNTNYTMTQHGFARDSVFELLSKNDCEIWLRLESNDNTKVSYPFDFILDIGYKLIDSKVEVMWRVSNTGEEVMYFSIGAHPGFFYPLHDKERMEKFGIDFHVEEPLEYLLVDGNGYVDKQKYSLTTSNGIIHINEYFFDRDALIAEGNQTHKVSLMDENNNKYITVEFDAPLFGIWSPPKKNAPFICIEPWYGRSDAVTFTGDLNEKEWINELYPNNTFCKSYSIKVVSDH